MEDRVHVSWDQVSAFTLSRQGLLEPFRRNDLAHVVGDIAGLQAQILPICPLQLWARVRDFRSQDLWDSLYHSRSVVRTWAMRATLHLLPSERVEIFLSAIGPFWLNTWTTMRRKLEKNLRVNDFDRARAALVAMFREGPRTYQELREAARDPAVNKVVSVAGWNATLRILSYWGDVVHGEMRGPEVVFHDAAEWLGRPLHLCGPAEAAGELLRMYLQAFGPASRQDFARWTALRTPQVQAAFDCLTEPLIEVSVRGVARPLFLRRRDAGALEAASIPEGHVRLLPKFDSLLLAHADRSRILDPEHARNVFPAVADVGATLLVGGRVAGVWHHERRGKVLDVRVEAFRRLRSPIQRAVRELAEDFGTFLGFRQTRLSLSQLNRIAASGRS